MDTAENPQLENLGRMTTCWPSTGVQLDLFREERSTKVYWKTV